MLESRENVRNRILYTGQQYDQETGQCYLRARYYNPVIGRFTQEDAYRGDGLNLYAYCGNNPVMYYDPSGHDTSGNGCGNSGSQNENGTTLTDRVESDVIIKADDKTEVILPSKPHRNGTEGHWETILDKVDEMEKSGEIQKYM